MLQYVCLSIHNGYSVLNWSDWPDATTLDAGVSPGRFQHKASTNWSSINVTFNGCAVPSACRLSKDYVEQADQSPCAKKVGHHGED
jgi:hypothetical protein